MRTKKSEISLASALTADILVSR